MKDVFMNALIARSVRPQEDLREASCGGVVML